MRFLVLFFNETKLIPFQIVFNKVKTKKSFKIKFRKSFREAPIYIENCCSKRLFFNKEEGKKFLIE